MNPATHFRSTRRSSRRGSVVAELAMVSPVLLLITLSTVGICNQLFLKQSLTVAAYEAARVAIIPEATSDDVRMQATEICHLRNVNGGTVSISPEDFQGAAQGTFLVVTVSAPSRQGNLDLNLFSGTTSVSVSMMKEY